VVQPLREKKKARTRDALVAAGMALFTERGFDAVTVADITAAADVAPRTFHRYFPDKTELLFAEDGHLREVVHAALLGQPPDADPATVVLAALTASCQPLAGRREEITTRDRLIELSPGLRARELTKRAELEQLIADHLADRLGVGVDHDVTPRWWAGVGLATFHAAYQTWLTQGGDLTTHLDTATRLLQHHTT